MGYVDDAFANLKRSLEITDAEQQAASRHHLEIRELVRSKMSLVDDFLTGAYVRDTKTKRLQDVDIMCVIDRSGKDGKLAKDEPSGVLARLAEVLGAFKTVSIDDRCCVVTFDIREEVVSFDVIPAFARSPTGFLIPDRRLGRWIATDPTRHAELATDKNKACHDRWKPLVKMIKGWNREAAAVKPSFLLEVMSLDLIDEPMGRYQDEVHWFLATAADQIADPWADPAGLGPDVNSEMDSSQKAGAASVLKAAAGVAGNAVWLEDQGREREAVEEWRKLFGWRMPRPA
jgi:hypothetical protein